MWQHRPSRTTDDRNRRRETTRKSTFHCNRSRLPTAEDRARVTAGVYTDGVFGGRAGWWWTTESDDPRLSRDLKNKDTTANVSWSHARGMFFSPFSLHCLFLQMAVFLLWEMTFWANPTWMPVWPWKANWVISKVLPSNFIEVGFQFRIQQGGIDISRNTDITGLISKFSVWQCGTNADVTNSI